jgi:hypothetical protein
VLSPIRLLFPRGILARRLLERIVVGSIDMSRHLFPGAVLHDDVVRHEEDHLIVVFALAAQHAGRINRLLRGAV